MEILEGYKAKSKFYKLKNDLLYIKGNWKNQEMGIAASNIYENLQRKEMMMLQMELSMVKTRRISYVEDHL